MDRLACVNVIALPLQLLAHRHPSWLEEGPMAVVDEDAPDGTIQYVDREGRRARIRPGMRYSEGLSIRRDLRAGTVEDDEIAEAHDGLLDRLRKFSPFVEASDRGEGIFWLDAAGLEGVFESLESWARAIGGELRETSDLYSSVVVGFTRFGTYAVARSVRRVVVFDERADERRAARRVSLRRTGLAPDLCDDLEQLGIETVGQFLKLPPAGIRRRFGARAHRLHQLARGDLELPLQADFEEGPLERTLDLEETVTVSTKLVFLVKRQLNPLLGQLADRQHKIAALELTLDDGTDDPETIRIQPATPTVDTGRLLELVRLKLEDRQLEQGVRQVEVRIRSRRVEGQQIQLFAERPPRDLEDANRALERLRAELGRRAVVRADLREGHLPEARVEWEPMECIEQPDPPDGPDRTSLIRRQWTDPRPLRARQTHAGQLELPAGDGVFLGGPYIVSGGWWVREVRRAYYFAERPSGELMWVYWDDRRERWFRQARVE